MTKTTQPPVVLIVDDNPRTVDMFQHFFSLLGWKVIGAETGEDGLIAISNNPIDIILLDLKGIKMEPYEFIQHVNVEPQGSRPEIPILIMSADLLEKITILLEEPGVKAGFHMPKSPFLISAKIKEVLGLN